MIVKPNESIGFISVFVCGFVARHEETYLLSLFSVSLLVVFSEQQRTRAVEHRFTASTKKYLTDLPLRSRTGLRRPLYKISGILLFEQDSDSELEAALDRHSADSVTVPSPRAAAAAAHIGHITSLVQFRAARAHHDP
jgi:hypothetical protein